MGKTRDFFKKVRDTKGTFHAKMGSITDRNGMDLTEAEDIKKRWQEYTEELYKKDLHNPDNHHGVITDLEPDILECEVKQKTAYEIRRSDWSSDVCSSDLEEVARIHRRTVQKRSSRPR